MTEKLLTVRIDETIKDKFSEYAKSHNSNASELIKLFIDRCLDNSIDITSFKVEKKSSQGLDISLDDIDKRIEERLSNYSGNDLSLDGIDERIDSYLDNSLKDRLSSYSENFNEAIALRDEKIESLETKLQEAIATLESKYQDLEDQFFLSQNSSPQNASKTVENELNDEIPLEESLQSKKSNSDGGLDSDKIYKLNEAWQKAKGRGYIGTKANFGQNFRDNKDKADYSLYGFKLIGKGKYLDIQ